MEVKHTLKKHSHSPTEKNSYWLAEIDLAGKSYTFSSQELVPRHSTGGQIQDAMLHAIVPPYELKT